MIINKTKYRIKFMGNNSLHEKVKVTGIFLDSNNKRWVEWRYNMPLPIYQNTLESEFISWILTKQK